MNLAAVTGVLGLAGLQGALVALPRADAFGALARMRSPAWAALLPGAIVVGTFAPLWHAALATGLVYAAAATAPLLAVLAVIRVVRGRGAFVTAAAIAALAGASLAPGTVGVWRSRSSRRSRRWPWGSP